ncbi:MAG: hypothetical protein HYR67_19905 [Bacteroidetes bacterium]|nr:hypothetical protein [Bacteroidota bacterium]
MRATLILLLIVFSQFVFSQSPDSFTVNENLFSSAEDKGQIEQRLNEASGLVASFKNPGFL